MLFIILLLSLVVSAKFTFKFNPSPIQQCKPVNVSFNGFDDDDKVPTSLTILPFGLPPISIPFSGANSYSAGVAFTFLPLRAGTRFMASLDDGTGDNSARVSDIFLVQDSDDSTCVPPVDPPVSFSVAFPSDVQQCTNFTLTYPTDQAPPTVRILMPNNGASLLPPGFSTQQGQATYVMNQRRGQELLLVAFNSESNNITQGLSSGNVITVDGDTSSPTTCFPPPSANNKSSNGDNNSNSSATRLQTGAIIGIVIGALVLVILLIVLFFVFMRLRRTRRNRIRRERIESFNPAFMEKSASFGKSDFYNYNGASNIKPPFSAASVTQSSPGFNNYNITREGYVVNPSYARRGSESTLSSAASPRSGSSPFATTLTPNRYVEPASPNTAQHHAVNTINAYDIERMLNYAASAGGGGTMVGTESPFSPIQQGSEPGMGMGMTPDTSKRLLGQTESFLTESITSFPPAENPFGDLGPMRQSPLPMFASSRDQRDSVVSTESFEIMTRDTIRPPPSASMPTTPKTALMRGDSTTLGRALSSGPRAARGTLVRIGSSSSSSAQSISTSVEGGMRYDYPKATFSG